MSDEEEYMWKIKDHILRKPSDGIEKKDGNDVIDRAEKKPGLVHAGRGFYHSSGKLHDAGAETLMVLRASLPTLIDFFF
jgi:hypothetical protein